MTPHVPAPVGDLVVAAILGAIVGGAVMAGFALAAPLLHRRLGRAAILVGAIIGIGTFALVIQTRAMDRLFGGYFSFKTPRERLEDHFADFDEQVARDPEIRRAIEGLPDPGMKLRTLSRLGVARLDDTTLLQRARLMGILLPQLSERACASVLGYSPPTQTDPWEAEQAMLRLESGFVAEWMQVLHKAMLAEVHQSAVRAVTDEEAGAAYQALVAKIGEDAAKRVTAGLAAGAPTAEHCWAAKTMYAVAPALAEPHGAVLLREILRSP